MPSSVKLTTAEFRAWRVNKAQWVSPEGYVLRAVTPEEEKALFPAVERTKQLGKTQAYNLTVSYKHEDADTGREAESKTQMEAVVRITPTGRERHNYLADIFVNGCRYVKGREIIEKRMLATHGECNLHGPNGKRLRVIRNPTVRRPTYSESQRVAPHPDNCHCRTWKDRGEPGRHHAACNWNDKAPPHERALPFQPVVEQTIVESPEPLESLAFDPNSVRAKLAPVERPRAPRVVPPPPGAPRRPQAGPGVNMDAPMYAAIPPALEAGQVVTRTRVPPVAPLPEVYPPSACPEDCRGAQNAAKAWRWPAGRKPEKGQHHPLCPHDAAYRQKQRGDRHWVLYDLERRTEVRDATSDEVTRSEIELSRSGTRSITVAGRIYAVVQAGQNAQAPRPRRPLAGASVRRAADAVTAQHQVRRQAALEQSRLPGVPGVYGSDSEEVAELRARLAALEGRTQGQLQVGAPFVPLPPEALTPVELPSRVAVAHPADHLRNDLGLVGHQQVTDDIPPGPVQLVDPEPFVDPIAERAATGNAARRPVEYHPGAVRPKNFVPPLPPGVSSPPLIEPARQEPEEEGPTDEDVARLVAEAEAAEAEVRALEAEGDESTSASLGVDEEEVDPGVDGFDDDEAGDEGEVDAAGPDDETESVAASSAD